MLSDGTKFRRLSLNGILTSVGILVIICSSYFRVWSQLDTSVKQFQGHVEDAQRSSSIYSSSTTTNKLSKAAPRLLHDPLCGGCRYSHVPITWQSGFCADMITKVMQSFKNVSLAQAGTHVGTKYPESCSRCLPDACNESAKKYWRFDDAAPRINFGRTQMVSALPSIYRFPKEAIETANLQNYVDYLERSQTKLMHLFDFNPSVVQLPPDQIPDIPGEKPVYLQSTRMNKNVYCFENKNKNKMEEKLGVGETLPDRFEMVERDRNYGIRQNLTERFQDELPELKLFGFSLLRADLSVIQETVIRFDSYPHNFNDLRLHSISDQLYFSSHDWIAPLWVIAPTDMTGKKTLHNEYLTSNMTITFGMEKHCCTSPECEGKNFNYFVDGNNMTMVELYPMNPHITAPIDLTRTCEESTVANVNTGGASISYDFPNTTSFYTDDEIYLHKHQAPTLPYQADRNTACCVSISDPRNGESDYLLSGISHAVLPYLKHGARNMSLQMFQYTLRLYAFEPFPPYRTVAVSGKFCLPYPDEEEAEGNYHTKLSRSIPNVLGHSNECPSITFAPTMIEAVDDPSKFIVTYGLNDCTARIVEIDKSEITRILFEPPSES
jgi:hypothetical protein